MKTVDSRCSWVVAQGGHSGTGIAYLAGLTREALKRETGSIESGDDLRVDLGGLGPESVISEDLGFHLNSRILTFTLMSPFCVNCVE